MTNTDSGNSGGLEMLFSNKREHNISLPAKDESGEPVTVNYLVHHLCKKVMKDHRKELFVQDGTVYVRCASLKLSHTTGSLYLDAQVFWC